MFGLTDKILSYLAGALALVMSLALAWQTYQLSSERTAHNALKLQVAQDLQKRTAAVLADEQHTAAKETTHATATQEISDAFTTTQPERDAAVRSDLDRVDRLRVAAERRAATYRAQAQANAAACGDSADRLAAFDRQLVAGVGVVAALRGDLGRRDAEVVLLRGQIDADRALIADGPATSGLGVR